MNDGAGGFEMQRTGTGIDQGPPIQAAFADFNGDGKLDAVSPVAAGGVRVLLDRCLP
jgi:hypothetical protein